MALDRNVVIVRRLYEEVYNAGKVEAIDQIYAPNFVSHPNAVSHDGIYGITGIHEFVMMLRTAIPDIHFDILDELATGDKVVTRWRMHGTMLGPLFGFQATAKLGSTTGITIHRVAEGRVVEAWEEADMLGAFDRFGIIPTMDV
jgi:predicted ester cyclase